MLLKGISKPGSWSVARLRPRPLFLAASLGVLFALAARLPYFVHLDFPLNDGGMFLAMSQDIIDAHYTLPVFTSYNFQSIPFAYPPLSFYLVAIISGLTHLEPLTLVMYLPLIANLATVVAVALLAQAMLGRGWAAWIAPSIFAVLPRSYEWMVMGGGLTRSVGFMFAIACLWQAAPLFERPTVRRTLLCAALAAATLASHLELGLFMAYSLLGMALLRGRSIRAILSGFSVLAFAVVFTSPWWATVIIRHGLAPFDAASQTGYWSGFSQSIDAFEHYTFPSGFLMSSLGVIAALGAIASVLRGEVFLPLWLPAVFVWVPRSAQSEATVPLAILAAVGLANVVVPGLAQALESVRRPPIPDLATAIVHRPVTVSYASRAMEVAGLLLLLGAVYIYSPKTHADPTILDSLPDADRQAMSWVAANTPASAQFLVVSNKWAWEADAAGEWFPVLAGRRSLLTPQGTEWLPSEAFSREVCVYNSSRVLATQGVTVDYLDEWARDRGLSYSYIYVSRSLLGSVSWDGLLESATKSPNYKVVLDNNAAVVLERTQPVKPFAGPEGQILVSRDCQSLADQSTSVQTSYLSRYGDYAAWEWVKERDMTLPPPSTICGKLDGSPVGQLGTVESVCRSTQQMAVNAADVP